MDKISEILKTDIAQEIMEAKPPTPLEGMSTDDLMGLLYGAYRLIEIQNDINEPTLRAVTLVTYCEILTEVNRRIVQAEQFQGLFG